MSTWARLESPLLLLELKPVLQPTLISGSCGVGRTRSHSLMDTDMTRGMLLLVDQMVDYTDPRVVSSRLVHPTRRLHLRFYKVIVSSEKASTTETTPVIEILQHQFHHASAGA